MQTAIQIGLTDDLRGRVMSLWIMVAIGAAALGAAISGALAEIAGLELTLLATGLTGLFLMVPVLRDILRTRRP